ncbi:hypothetical protein THAOC_33605 [Thalassiosira oceanica]|uniref:Uncharacterized protein n=1 Tax=Thalassiosira oceanica TaxID=159749 RepID=K0R3V6_THAOC|nr:hypothetical protein THAOC_33605 [Thalassiosira oceanica]|eukprot:EJK47658.1 hypothetical protein THAOC_33605 [Thalassiosira oceanica]
MTNDATAACWRSQPRRMQRDRMADAQCSMLNAHERAPKCQENMAADRVESKYRSRAAQDTQDWLSRLPSASSFASSPSSFFHHEHNDHTKIGHRNATEPKTNNIVQRPRQQKPAVQRAGRRAGGSHSLTPFELGALPI